jgi:hypothetical protein
LRVGALVKKHWAFTPIDNHAIYGRLCEDPTMKMQYVEVYPDQGWWMQQGTPHRHYRDYDLEGWHEVYEQDGDPMWLRETVLDIFERADIYVNDISCPENKTEEIDELYVKHHDRTRVFIEILNAIRTWERRNPNKTITRYDVVTIAEIDTKGKHDAFSVKQRREEAKNASASK